VSAFGKLDVKTKKIVVHDGIGHSFWLAPNNEPEKRAGARIDWAFTVWQPGSWERVRELPSDLNPTDSADSGPPALLDVFTGQLRWSEVAVPAGIDVLDMRLEAHGFTTADGVVIEGTVTDLATGQAIAAAARLERVEPQAKGGYRYPAAAQAKASAAGHWVLKKVPAGWVRIVVEATGFVPRVAGYLQLDDQPRWRRFDCGLSRSAPVSGAVTDEAENPLADVAVRLQDVAPASGGRYESPLEYSARTDAQGRFRINLVPTGKATVWVRKSGFCRPGVGLPITMPKEGVELKMVRSASVRATVDFAGRQRPNGYIVTIEPEGGNAIGTFGGSGNIDATNQIVFDDVPPGRYVLWGERNPSSGDQRTERVTIALKGGDNAEVTLKAR
jgi:hypothetical protein